MQFPTLIQQKQKQKNGKKEITNTISILNNKVNLN